MGCYRAAFAGLARDDRAWDATGPPSLRSLVIDRAWDTTGPPSMSSLVMTERGTLSARFACGGDRLGRSCEGSAIGPLLHDSRTFLNGNGLSRCNLRQFIDLSAGPAELDLIGLRSFSEAK